MKKWISISEKRNFLNWFLTHQRLKRSEARRFLEFIVNRPHILENVSFTEKINVEGKTIVISSLYSDEAGFEYYSKYRKVSDVSTAIADITANPSEKLYLILHFQGKMSNHRYLQLIEIPAVENIKQYARHQQQAKEVDAIIEMVMRTKEQENLKNQIDAALDQRDEQLFKELAAKLQRLEKG